MNLLFRRFVLALTAVFALSASAAAPQPSHSHSGALKLELNAGKKWETDPPLRKGMEAIKGAIEAKAPRLHSGRMTAAEFAALGKTIDQEIQGIFAACKLPPAADQNLHQVLVRMMNGTQKLQDPKAKHREGVVEIVGALDAYGEYFDDAGWTPVKH